jgi:hypothetical protein
MVFQETNHAISSGSGFLYSKDENFYLITNWHNVSGRNPLTGKPLSSEAAIPDLISTLFTTKSKHEALGKPIFLEKINLQLYENSKPVWYEHPEHGCKVDVVAIKLNQSLSSKYDLQPINKIDFEETKERVADEAFIIGYPFFDRSYPQLPIWKKASIASEPDINIDKLPKMLVDTATRHGLSGSPVIMQRHGIHGLVDGKFTDTTIIGTIRTFLGIYSGRIGDDELKAQLGIVWKKSVIEEIISGKVLGSTEISI